MSKIKTVKTGIDFIKEWVIKTALKQQPKGVLTTLPKKDFVELNTGITAERLMRYGVDPNSIKNVDQVENIINQLNKPRAVAADSPEGKGITEALLGKKGEVFNLQGEKLDPSKPIVGGSQSGKKINRKFFERDAEAKEVQKRIDSGVASTVEKMLAMEPIYAMKEANKVIGRKGQYKNLSQEDAKKILQDTEDHIFERNVDIDPEDMFADGGRIGLKGGADAATESFTKSAGSSAKGRKGSVNVSSSGNVTFNPGGKDDPVDDRSSFEQTINQRNVIDKTKNKENVFKDIIQGGADFNYLRNLYKLNPKGIGASFIMNKIGNILFPPAGAAEPSEDELNILRATNPKGYDDAIKGILEQAGDVMFPEGNLQNIKATAPDQKTYNIEATKDMVENLPGGLLKDIVAPAGALVMSPFYDAGQAFDRMEPGSGITGFAKALDAENPISSAAERFIGASAPLAERLNKADGGRIGFKKGMDRRTFMKIMGGLTTIPVFGKFFKGAEVAAPVVEKAAEVASGAPPYFFNLVNRIRALGKQSPGPKERSETYKYKDYEMQVDNDTGQIEITKQKLGYDDRIGEGVVSEEYMSLKPGRADETTGGKKVVDEYEENTGYTDKDGKLKDVEPGVSEETVMDGSISKEELEQEIIEQLSKEAPSIKKASGGIARMLGE